MERESRIDSFPVHLAPGAVSLYFNINSENRILAEYEKMVKAIILLTGFMYFFMMFSLLINFRGDG